MTMYPIDDFKMLRGGVLHLVGEFQLFWSETAQGRAERVMRPSCHCVPVLVGSVCRPGAVLNFADFHSCAPLEGLYKQLR